MAIPDHPGFDVDEPTDAELAAIDVDPFGSAVSTGEPRAPRPVASFPDNGRIGPSNAQDGVRDAFDAALDPEADIEPVEGRRARAKRAADEADRKARIAELEANGWLVELPSGRKATFRDPRDLTEAQRRAYKQAQVEAQLLMRRAGTDERNPAKAANVAARFAVSADYILVAMFVESWTHDAPVPRIGDYRSIDNLPGRDLDRIIWTTKDFLPEMYLDVEPSPEPDTPFAPSSG